MATKFGIEDIPILFEDNHLLVVVKPHNLPSQSDSSGDTDLLSLLKEYVKIKYNKPGEAFVGLVHRLDRPTGGVMVFARTSKAASRLAEQMAAGEFAKRYVAVVVGVPRESRARLTNWLVKNPEQNTVRVAPAAIEGARKAILDYQVLETFEGHSLVDISLVTGRSHQARVQMAHIGTPISGDMRYGVDGPGAGTLALWAYNLRFAHPTTAQPMVFRVFPPIVDPPWRAFHIERHLNLVAPK